MAIVLGLILIFLIAATLALCAAYEADSIFGNEDFATSPAAILAVAEILRQNHLEQSLLYDLGSSRGNFIFKILGACPGLKEFLLD